MAPPKFGDLGKGAKDLFNDDFGFGETKLTLKSTASNGVNFKVEGTRASDSGAVSAFLETKYTHSNGVSLKEKWTTKNVVTAEVSADNKLVAGSKVTLESSFSPNGGGVSGLKLKTEYKTDAAFADLALSASSASVSSVFSLNKFFLGAQADYDFGKGTLSGTKVAASYVEKDLVVTSSIANGSDVEGSILHAARPGVTAGVKFAWKKNSNDTCFGVVGRYQLDNSAFVKAKICKSLNVGLSYTQVLRPGVTLGFYSKINAAQLNSDAHQLGFALTLEN